MLYDQTAKVLKREQVSDGIGGWTDAGEPVELAKLKVMSAPVTAEHALKQYGIVTTTSQKLYTIDAIPEGDVTILFNNKEYRILQQLDYNPEKALLVELIKS